MAKIQTSLGLTPTAKQMLDQYCQDTGLSQNKAVENLILDHLFTTVKIPVDFADYYVMAKLKNDTFYRITVYEGIPHATGSTCFVINEFKGSLERLQQLLNQMIEVYDPFN